MELRQVEEALEDVILPEPRRSLLQLNMVRDIEVAGDGVKVILALTALSDSAKELIQESVRAAIGRIPGVGQVTIDLVEPPSQELNEFEHVIAVMSGKGGVGKSLIAALLAIALTRQGYQVGILDADVTGPSIPKMFGLKGRPMGSESAILPVETTSGIEVMSINLLLPHEDDAVIWRGPLIAKVIAQFWQNVVWGKLDYLIVDLPPGTSDIPLTVMQSLHPCGVVIVLTPQDLAAMVVKKAVHMAHQLNVPILGVVENMSYLLLPETGKRVEIFGQSKGEDMALKAEAPLLGRLPLDPELAQLCDSGEIERYNSDAFIALSLAFVRAMPALAHPLFDQD
ncbi:MAG: Mrp/NBP35 family ATP-binding protein [Dehalococcoidia bacterium]